MHALFYNLLMPLPKSYARRLVEQDEKREAKAKTLGRKRCENCPKFFEKKRSWQRFCSKECKDQFNKNGSAYGKLKDTLTKLIVTEVRLAISSELRVLVQELVREQLRSEPAASQSRPAASPPLSRH